MEVQDTDTNEVHHFFSYLGDHDLRGVATGSTKQFWRLPKRRPPPLSYKMSLKAFLELAIATKLTVQNTKAKLILLLNIGWWPHNRDVDELGEIFEAGKKLTPFVFWRQTSPGVESGKDVIVESSKNVESSEILNQADESDVDNENSLFESFKDSDTGAVSDTIRIILEMMMTKM